MRRVSSARILATDARVSAARRLRDLNPRLEIVAVPENVTEENAERLGVKELSKIITEDAAKEHPELKAALETWVDPFGKSGM